MFHRIVLSVMMVMIMMIMMSFGQTTPPSGKILFRMYNDFVNCSGDYTEHIIPQNTCSNALGVFTASEFSCRSTTCMNMLVYQGHDGCSSTVSPIFSLIPNQCTGPAVPTSDFVYEACAPSNDGWYMQLGCTKQCGQCPSSSTSIPIGTCTPEPYSTKLTNASYLLKACTPCLASDMVLYAGTSCGASKKILVQETLASGWCYPATLTKSYSVICPVD